MMWTPLARIRERWSLRRWLARVTGSGGRLVVCAGMPRSGSTWLFNAARLLLQREYPGDFASGWIGDFRQIRPAACVLLKVHDFDPILVENANAILYSYRDLRDALASSQRMFKQPSTLAMARRWIRHDRSWRRWAGFVMRYESMRGDPHAHLHHLAATLDIGAIDAQAVLDELSRLRFPSSGYDPVNLLHPGHITDGRHGSWQRTLPPELVFQVEHEFTSWFVENGYTLSLVASVAAPHESNSLARANT